MPGAPPFFGRWAAIYPVIRRRTGSPGRLRHGWAYVACPRLDDVADPRPPAPAPLALLRGRLSLSLSGELARRSAKSASVTARDWIGAVEFRARRAGSEWISTHTALSEAPIRFPIIASA